MSGIIPSWKIADLLNDEVFKVKRDHEDRQREKARSESRIEHTGAGARHQLTTPKTGEPIDIPVPSERQFDRDLDKVIRRKK